MARSLWGVAAVTQYAGAALVTPRALLTARDPYALICVMITATTFAYYWFTTTHKGGALVIV